MNDKRYTAQEMRDKAKSLVVDNLWPEWSIVVVMLRQAADTEEELATLKGERNGLLKANESLAKDNDRLRGENAKLKARLKAVVKECEESLKGMSIKQIMESVKKVGDPWLNPRTRLFDDGTYTGDGHDLIACRDIVHDLHKLWFEKGEPK